MITIHVQLMGTLPARYSLPYPAGGLDIDIAETTSVSELVKKLGLAEPDVALVSINGMLAHADDIVRHGAEVKLFQRMHGG